MSNNTVFISIGKRLKLNKIKYLIKFIKDVIHYRGLLYGKLISIKEIIAGNFPDVEILNCENVRLYYSCPVFNDGADRKMELLEGKDYTQYTVRIKNAIVYGDSNLITLSSGKVLFDMPAYDKLRRYEYTNYNSKIIKVKGNHVYYWKGITHPLEKAVWMGGNFSWNYYHLLYEFVIKFLYLNKSDIPLNVPVLVDQRCLEVPQYKELLDIANYKDYKLIGVDRSWRFSVGEIIYINCPNFIPLNNVDDKDSRVDDIQFNISALCDLRNYFLPYSSNREFHKRIYISRKNASRRRRFNEDAVMQLLSEFGFETVCPEKLSIPDQISLFNQADWIIGGSGAAFTNLLFCNSGTKVILLTKGRGVNSIFSTIACAINVDLVYITEEDTNKDIFFNGIHDVFELDISYLREFLINNISLNNN